MNFSIYINDLCLSGYEDYLLGRNNFFTSFMSSIERAIRKKIIPAFAFHAYVGGDPPSSKWFNMLITKSDCIIKIKATLIKIFLFIFA